MNYYNQIAEGYEELHKEEQLKKIELIKQYLKPKQTDLLLDVASGTGLTTEPWNCRRIGIDPAIKLLEIARKKQEISYINAEAEHIPFKDKSFDVVISITALQNFNDIEKGLSEIKRVGKEKFILSALKKSSKIKKIKGLINKTFKLKKIIEENKDIIFII